MSIRSGTSSSALASGMSAWRSLSQSLARGLGPEGIHVAHTIVDGVIDTPSFREDSGEDAEEKRMKNMAMA
nr:hypothetical protein L204_04943 [Cryptococcus depauperatus CBS 7855]